MRCSASLPSTGGTYRPTAAAHSQTYINLDFSFFTSQTHGHPSLTKFVYDHKILKVGDSKQGSAVSRTFTTRAGRVFGQIADK